MVRAWREVQVLRHRGTEPNVYHFGADLKARNWRSCSVLLYHMQILQVRLNDVILNTAVDLHAKGSQWTSAFQLFGAMPQAALPCDAIGAGACISSLRKRHAWPRALALLSAQMTLVLCNAVLSVMEVQWRTVLWMFQWSSKMFQLDTISYSAVLSAYASGGLWIRSFQLMKQMLQQQVLSDLISWNTAANSWAQTGSLWLMALHQLLSLRHRRLLPSVVSVTSAMNACHKGTAWPHAIAAHRESLPTRASSNCLLSAMARGNHWRAALPSLAHADATGRTAIIEALGPSQWPRVTATALDVDVEPLDAVGFNAVLSILELAKQWRCSLEVLQQMQKLFMELSVTSYGPLLSHTALLEEMTAAQVAADTLALTFAVDGVGDAVQLQALLGQLQDLSLQGLAGPSRAAEPATFRDKKER